ncbi:MAG: GNAT family N-acetyltransferase [Paludibacteraceae bacterium]
MYLIETYFKIEASDIETFSHVEEIVEQCGQIFLAIDNGKVVGCCALEHHKEADSYELAKMAALPRYQGKHIASPCRRAGTNAHHALIRFSWGRTHAVRLCPDFSYLFYKNCRAVAWRVRNRRDVLNTSAEKQCRGEKFFTPTFYYPHEKKQDISSGHHRRKH